MRPILSIVIVFMCATVGCASADPAQSAPANPLIPGYVSPFEAIQAVRKLARDNHLEVTIVKYPPTDGSVSQVGCHYFLTAGAYIYQVGYRYPTIIRHLNTSSGAVRATPVARPSSGAQATQEQPQDVTQQDAQNVAYQFMAADFPVPAQDMVLLDSQTTQVPDQANAWYTFIYHQAAADGFIGPADCYISVDSASGDVTDCILNDFPLLVDNAPLLNADQAIADASQAIGYVPDGTPAVTLSWIAPPDDLGSEEQGYNISLPGYAFGNMSDWENWCVTLDANTGAILLEDVVAGMRPKSSVDLTALQAKAIKQTTSRPYPRLVGRQIGMTKLGRKGFLDRPALMIESDPYVYLGYAVAAAQGSDAMSAGGAINVTASGKRIAFRPGEADYTLNGRITALRHRSIYVAGAYYIPIELANEIAPGRFVYDAKAAAVDYRPAPASVGPDVRHE